MQSRLELLQGLQAAHCHLLTSRVRQGFGLVCSFSVMLLHQEEILEWY